jgi:hypothetical protein
MLARLSSALAAPRVAPRRARASALALLAAIALSAAAGCPTGPEGPGAPGGPAGAAPPGAPEVRIEVPAEVAFGEAFPARVVVRNTAVHPIAVVGLVVRHGERTLARVEGTELTAALGEGGGALEGTLLVDDPGPAARAPAPPRWEWRGGDAIVSTPVLAPGGSLEASASAPQVEAGASSVEVTLFYAPLATPTALLRVEGLAIEPAGAAAGGPGAGPGPEVGGAPFGRARLAPAARLVARLVPAAADLARGAGEDPARPLAPRLPEGGNLSWVSAPAIYPTALRKEETERLAVKGAQVGRPLALRRPGFDLPAARERAGIAAGRAVYLAAAGAWLLEPLGDGSAASAGSGAAPSGGAGAGAAPAGGAAEGRSAWVSATTVVRVAGRPAALAVRIAERAATGSPEAAERVALYARSGTADPDGLAAALSAKGIRVEEGEEKGGTRRGDARVTARTLGAFLEALAARGLGVEEGRVVRP